MRKDPQPAYIVIPLAMGLFFLYTLWAFEDKPLPMGEVVWRVLGGIIGSLTAAFILYIAVGFIAISIWSLIKTAVTYLKRKAG